MEIKTGVGGDFEGLYIYSMITSAEFLYFFFFILESIEGIWSMHGF